MDSFSKNTQISNFMKIRSVGAELFHEDRWMDRHDVSCAKCFPVDRQAANRI